jgi:hypothetical protein
VMGFNMVLSHDGAGDFPAGQRVFYLQLNDKISHICAIRKAYDDNICNKEML